MIPVAYWLLYANKPGHGLPQSSMEQENASAAMQLRENVPTVQTVPL